VKSYVKVETVGLTLDELASFATSFGVSAEVIHAADVTPEAMRTTLRTALRTAGVRVIANYSRIPLDQEGDGHISPIAAYDAETDSFLVLDVARYKYPAAWVSFDQFWAAMLRIDSESGLSRGALILSAKAAHP
jgi:hypothetical protein